MYTFIYLNFFQRLPADHRARLSEEVGLVLGALHAEEEERSEVVEVGGVQDRVRNFHAYKLDRLSGLLYTEHWVLMQLYKQHNGEIRGHSLVQGDAGHLVNKVVDAKWGKRWAEEEERHSGSPIPL
jgi:hypothetical protein